MNKFSVHTYCACTKFKLLLYVDTRMYKYQTLYGIYNLCDGVTARSKSHSLKITDEKTHTRIHARVHTDLLLIM